MGKYLTLKPRGVRCIVGYCPNVIFVLATNQEKPEGYAQFEKIVILRMFI